MRGKAHNRNAGWAWLLVAAVLMLRAAVPQGFMPERTAAGEFAITVCGAGGLVHIPVGKDHKRSDSAPSHCAFAGLGAPADLPPAIVLPNTNWAGHAFASRTEAAQRAAALFPRPPSRAPPILA